MLQKTFYKLIGAHVGQQKFSNDILWNLGSLGILASSGILLNILLASFGGLRYLGVFNQIFAFYLIASQLAVGGLQFSTLQKISYAKDDPPQQGRVISSALLLVTVWGIAISGIAYLVAPQIGHLLNSEDVGRGIRYISPGLFFYGINKVLLSVVNGSRHMRAYAIFQAARYLNILLWVSIGLFMLISPAEIALALPIAELILCLGLLWYVATAILPLSQWKLIQTGALLEEHLTFAYRGAASGILTELNTKVDILMLGAFSTDSVVGIYSFAATLAEGIKQIPSVVRWNVDPILGESFSKKETTEIEAFAEKVRKMMLPLMVGCSILGLLGYPVLLYLIHSGGALERSFLYFAVLLGGVFMNSFITPFTGLLLQGNRPGMHSLLILTLLFSNILFNLILIPILGALGAAIATSTTFLLEAILITLLARHIFHIHLLPRCVAPSKTQ